MTIKKTSLNKKTGKNSQTGSNLQPQLTPVNSPGINRSLTVKAALHSDRYLNKWIDAKIILRDLQVTTTSLHAINGWSIDSETGDIRHESGKFFAITGALVRHRSDTTEISWDQPIIDQPEVGILGILAKKIRGVLHVCLQSKEEPGNINSVQLSPTVQATYSNYTQVHGGSPPMFIEYFTDPAKGQLITARLQTEDGGRFLYKSNRNMIVAVGEDELEDLPDNFIWVTLRQIGQLMKRDNIVHACTRSILSTLALRGEMNGATRSDKPLISFHKCSLNEIFQWMDNRKAVNHFMIKRIPLNSLKEWGMDRDGSFSHEHGRFFRVIGLTVESNTREVSAWGQPILDNPGTGIVGLLTTIKDGERFFLMQAKAEFGNRGIIQIGPTVQFTPGNYIGNVKIKRPFLFEEFYKPGKFRITLQSLQSEEGARFYNEAHLHRILFLPECEQLTIPDDFRWIAQSDLNFLINLGDTVNSCARSIISLMLCNPTVS